MKPGTHDETYFFYETQCCRHKLNGVYIRETCFKRCLVFHETVSSNMTLLCFLKLVSHFSRLLANHSSAFPEGQFTCNSCNSSNVCKSILRKFLSSLGPHFEVLLTKYGEPNIHFFVEELSIIRGPFKCCIASAMTIRHNGTTISSSSVRTMLAKALCMIIAGKSNRYCEVAYRSFIVCTVVYNTHKNVLQECHTKVSSCVSGLTSRQF